MYSSKPPDEFELALHDDRRVNLRLIGASSQGWVCSTRARDACYRLLPIGGGFGEQHECEDTPVERRQDFRAWMANSPSAPHWVAHPLYRHLAPITDDGQCRLPVGDHHGWYYVRYEIPHTTSLMEILAGSNFHAKLDAVILVFYQLQAWWQELRPDLIPFAADIVFDAEKRPFLLAAPAWRYPDIGSLFSEPSRALFLPPEYLCGMTKSETSANIDRFALGVIALQVFRRIPEVFEVKSSLPRMVTGSIWKNLASNLPSWLQRLQATTEAETAVYCLINSDPQTRASIHLSQLIQTLESCRRRTEPSGAIRNLLEEGRAHEAYELLHEILLVDDSIPMLILAGEVAQICNRSLEAVDRLEQVIDRTPDNLEAYRMQFQLLNTENCREEITSLLPRQPNLGPRVDEKMWRNFQRLDTADSSFELENKFVDYMFWRDMEIYAAPFIYQRLFDSEKKFLWWKFSLRFRYVCALFHAGLQLRAANRPAEAESYLRSAQEELGAIKTALFNAHSAGLLKAEEREQYFGETRQLELLLATLGLPSHAS